MNTIWIVLPILTLLMMNVVLLSYVGLVRSVGRNFTS